MVYIYPAQSVVASNPSVGLNGDPAPLSSTQIAGNDGTDLVPLSVDSSGALALPQGAATEATLQTLATEATVSTLATEATVATLATEATVATLATEATVATLATEATVATLATEATVATLATEATVATLATAAAQTDGTQKTQIVDGSGNVISSTSNSLNVNVTNSSSGTTLTGVVDANNSSSTPLGIGAIFTGTATDIKDYGTVSVLVASDVAAATGGFSFQFSNDGTNWDHSHNFDFAGGNLSYNISAEARYFRLVYTNGAVAQTHFRLQTVLRPVNVAPSQYTIAQGLTGTALATPTKSVIYGQTTGGGGGYVAVKVNPSGALTVDSTVTSSALPTGAATETTLSALNQRLAGSLTPVKFDEIALTYVVAGNGIGEVATAVFKLATVTVKTLTLSYDSNNRLTGVVAT